MSEVVVAYNHFVKSSLLSNAILNESLLNYHVIHRLISNLSSTSVEVNFRVTTGFNSEKTSFSLNKPYVIYVEVEAERSWRAKRKVGGAERKTKRRDF